MANKDSETGRLLIDLSDNYRAYKSFCANTKKNGHTKKFAIIKLIERYNAASRKGTLSAVIER